MPARAKARSGGTPAELHIDGLDIAPGVLETIVGIAAAEVDGVACVDATGLAGLMAKAGRNKPVEVALADDGGFAVTVHVNVSYGRPLRPVASDVQRIVADALVSQIGHRVTSVDVYVDGVVFPE
jgi:uncharacterized alkaline shock family protein YloU